MIDNRVKSAFGFSVTIDQAINSFKFKILTIFYRKTSSRIIRTSSCHSFIVFDGWYHSSDIERRHYVTLSKAGLITLDILWLDIYLIHRLFGPLFYYLLDTLLPLSWHSPKFLNVITFLEKVIRSTFKYCLYRCIFTFPLFMSLFHSFTFPDMSKNTTSKFIYMQSQIEIRNKRIIIDCFRSLYEFFLRI